MPGRGEGGTSARGGGGEEVGTRRRSAARPTGADRDRRAARWYAISDAKKAHLSNPPGTATPGHDSRGARLATRAGRGRAGKAGGERGPVPSWTERGRSDRRKGAREAGAVGRLASGKKKTRALQTLARRSNPRRRRAGRLAGNAPPRRGWPRAGAGGAEEGVGRPGARAIRTMNRATSGAPIRARELGPAHRAHALGDPALAMCVGPLARHLARARNVAATGLARSAPRAPWHDEAPDAGRPSALPSRPRSPRAGALASRSFRPYFFALSASAVRRPVALAAPGAPPAPRSRRGDSSGERLATPLDAASSERRAVGPRGGAPRARSAVERDRPRVSRPGI